MANKKITDYTLTTTIATDDLVEYVDISDTTDAATGTNKRITYGNLVGEAFLRADGSVALSADWDVGTGIAIQTGTLSARSSDGMSLTDDAGNIGIYIKDGISGIGFGTADPLERWDFVGATPTQEALAITHYRADGNIEPAIEFKKSNSNTKGTLSETQDGDRLGVIGFNGVDTGSNFDKGASIIVTQDGIAGTKLPGKFEFKVFNAVGSSSSFYYEFDKLSVPNEICHVGDDDTKLIFTPNEIALEAGGTSDGLKLTSAQLSTSGEGETIAVSFESHFTINDTTAFAEGVGGGLTFRGKYNTAGNSSIFGGIKGIKESVIDGNYNGALTFYTRAHGGNATEKFRVSSGGDFVIGDTTATAKLDVNGDSVRVRTAQTPASGGTGVQGEIAWGADYIYVCTATNTWKRAALTGGY